MGVVKVTIIYLTFADQPSGVYRSQVEDVVNYLNTINDSEVRLVSFISLRGFRSNRKRIRSNVPKALVLPMWPKLKNWLLNRFLLYFIFVLKRPNIIIARNVFAGYLALKCKSKGLATTVVYDGRGAISAEWNEYEVVENEILRKNIKGWEKAVVLGSDKQISISKKLIAYWKSQYGFSGSQSTIIPCTLSKVYENVELNLENQIKLKKQLGFQREDVILIFSGSTAGWQSSELLAEFVAAQLSLQEGISVLFLSKETGPIAKLKNDFPGRVVSVFLQSEEVPNFLLVGDYGLLIREDTVTNEVSSPVKFAEYLACGLKVIISSKIGDYSQMVKENEVGIVYNSMPTILLPVDVMEKQRCRNFALQNFAKNQYKDAYKTILKT